MRREQHFPVASEASKLAERKLNAEAEEMGCCESSNRRKIDDTLNPIMGTVSLKSPVTVPAADALIVHDRFRARR